MASIAKWLGAGVIVTVAAYVGVTVVLNEVQKSQFPSLAVAFNKNGDSFLATKSRPQQSAQEAYAKCGESSPSTSECSIKMITTSGSPACVTYGSVRLKKYQFNLGLGEERQLTTLTFASASTGRPTSANRPLAFQQCLNDSVIMDFPQRFCRPENFKTACNYGN